MEKYREFIGSTGGLPIEDLMTARTSAQYSSNAIHAALVVATVSQVALLERLKAAGLLEAGHPHYVSTYCIHELHGKCRLTCKTCQSACLCPCHVGSRGERMPGTAPADTALITIRPTGAHHAIHHCSADGQPWPCTEMLKQK